MTRTPLPRVFIGSSSEGVEYARYLQDELRSIGSSEPTIWTQGVFQASGYTMDSLVEDARSADFAVLIATPDDTVESRGDTWLAPRDNIIFELGLFVGALGRERTYIIADTLRGLKLPSDLNGLTFLPYQPHHNKRAAAAGPALAIHERIQELGPRAVGDARPTSSGVRAGPTSTPDPGQSNRVEEGIWALDGPARISNQPVLGPKMPFGHYVRNLTDRPAALCGKAPSSEAGWVKAPAGHGNCFSCWRIRDAARRKRPTIDD